ncbi:MAG TPA: FtsX-like permease family protein [Anaerolineales bacterium]|nr:FtsX-like permease family protein [Anaerolineales bacterium]
MLLYLRLAWRNIWRHRRRTVIVVVAMGLGLAMMMAYDGLMDGFTQAIYGNAIKVLGGNIHVHAAGYSEKADSLPLLPIANDQTIIQRAKSLPNVIGASRRINTGGLATNTEGAFSVTITGIEPEQEAPISPIAQNVKSGRYLTSQDQDVVLIGRGLAQQMDVNVGDKITLVGRSTHQQMRQRPMTILGIYDIGVPTFEEKTVYISLAEAQNLYDLPNQSTDVMITLQKLGQEPPVIAALTPSLNGDEIESWAQSFPDLQQAINTKSGVMQIFSIIIMLIAGIGVLNLLLMAVYERTREIGLLGAMGLKPRQIMTLFVLEGTMLGLVGCAVGLGLGLIINGSLGSVGLDFTQYASISDYVALINGRVYPSLALGNFVNRAVPVLIVAILAALYPAHEASQREPAEALHYV